MENHEIVTEPGFYIFENEQGNEEVVWVDGSQNSTDDKGLTTRHYYEKPITIIKKFFTFMPVSEYEELHKGKFTRKAKF